MRRLVGYDRFDTPQQVKQLKQLNQLNDLYRLYVNFFMPVTKLQRKERHGSKVKKVYNAPKTPYHRLLDAPEISDSTKASLRKAYNALDPVHL